MYKRNILSDSAILNYSVPLNYEHDNYYNDTNIADVYIEYKTYKIYTYWWNLFRSPIAIYTGTAKLKLPHCKTIDEIYTVIKQTKPFYNMFGYKSIKKDNYIQKMVTIAKWVGNRNPQITYWLDDKE